MAYNGSHSRRSSSNEGYVRFNSYSGADKQPAAAQKYQQMPQRPDTLPQGLNSVPNMDMNSAPPPNMMAMDNRFANAPPPNIAMMAPQQQQQHQQQAPSSASSSSAPLSESYVNSRVIEFESNQLCTLLTDPQYRMTTDGRPTKVMIKVYTDWCPPCNTIKPKFDEMSTMPEFQDVLFASVNGEKMGPDLSRLIAVSAVPVFFTFQAGQKVNMIPGADPNKIMEAAIELVNRK